MLLICIRDVKQHQETRIEGEINKAFILFQTQQRCLLLLRHTNSFSLVTSSLGVLSSHPKAPVVPKTPVGTDLLQTLKVLTKLVVQDVSHDLVGLAVLDVPLPVKEPVGDLVLAGVLHNGDELFSIFLSELTSPLGEGDVGLLEHNVGVPAADTLDGGQREHDAGFSLNVGVEDTQDVLEVGRHHQRHGAASLLSLVEVNQAIKAW